MAHAPDETVPVAIVGAGPTGVAAATLLARSGIECLLLDRFCEPYPQPRAVHLDDEVYRILARLGVGDGFARISRPMLGLRLVDSAGRRLAEFPRPPERARHGYPQANLFDQPELECLLRTELGRHPQVRLGLGTEVVGLAPTGSSVRVDVVDPSGRRRSITAQYVLGCDGANSGVRTAVGMGLRDLGFQQRWLVVDLATDTALAMWDGVNQICDARRPATCMRIGKRRYRWEFRLGDSESAADFADLDALLPLLGPWVAGVEPSELHVVRVREYTFRSAVAERWRSGRVFLLGDAAHLMPPFTGQGLGAGLRDAHNLAWKLAAVLHGRLSEGALDSYQAEREPHLRALIRLATIVGSAMTAGGHFGDVLRQVIAPRLHLVPGLRSRTGDSQTPRLRRSALVRPSPTAPRLVGSPCPNAVLADGQRFDDLADGRFALVTTRPLAAAQQAVAEKCGAVVLLAERGSALSAWLRRSVAGAALVRPDFVVLAAARRPEPLLAVLRDLGRGADQPLQQACVAEGRDPRHQGTAEEEATPGGLPAHR